MGENTKSVKSTKDMTDEEFRVYIQNLNRRLREPYGTISDRAWELIQELRKRKIAGKSSFGYPLLHEGIGAFAEAVVQHYPDQKAKRLAGMVVTQALADFVAQSEPFRVAMRALIEAQKKGEVGHG